MRQFCDVLLLIVSTIIFVRSVRLIAKYKSNSLSDWAILLLYVFQSLPVLFDLLLGLPKYSVWFSGFTNAMSDDTVCIIYDMYVIAINIFLYLVSRKAYRVGFQNYSSNIQEITKEIPNFALILLILSPAIHVVLSGNIFAFFVYNSIGERGLSSSFTGLNSTLVIIAILALMIWYFRKESNLLRILGLVLFSLIIIWISGKRYSVITILFSFLYMYVLEHRESNHKLNIRLLMVVLAIGVIAYSIFYITSIKITAENNFDSIYAALRIDFGRDDVVKFTIWKEYIQKEHILEYPLQTVISTIFMIVPRFIFPGKGYPHYRYLTAALYNTDIMRLPAGMTPSILEMMISNFRYLGIPICIAFLCWYCRRADQSTTSLQHYCYAMVMMGMLSQSLDSMIVLFYMVLFFILFKKVKLRFGSRKLYR